MNLYRVKLRGMQSSRTGIAYGDSYVLAHNPTEAYQKVREFLDKSDIGFLKDRELESLELLANTEGYSIGRMVFV